MRAIVTGGEEFIGSHGVDRRLADGGLVMPRGRYMPFASIALGGFCSCWE